MVLLCLSGFTTNEKYELLLHKYFLNNPYYKILLELEECSPDILRTNAILENYWKSENRILDVDVFGNHLFCELESIYESKKFSIEEFGERCYSLWNFLPSHIHQKEPFLTLLYADDCLSWNDEEQTRKLYEDAFNFYSCRK